MARVLHRALAPMTPSRLIIFAALLAAALKCAWAATSFGTNDTVVFFLFGAGLTERGLVELYDVPMFNHTPLVGTYIEAIYGWANRDGQTFAFLLRLPGIVADFGTVLALLWLRRKTGQPPWWAIAVLALSPVSLMVSGYHGNVDSVLVLALTLAGCACVARRPELCGLALAGALQVKIVPLLFVPAFFFWWWQQGRARLFVMTAALVTLAGWIVPLVAVPGPFLKNVLAYPSFWGTWGITLGLRGTGLAMFQQLGFERQSAAQFAVGLLLKAVIVSATLLLAWRRRKENEVLATIALTWLVFFAFAPGFGVQYLVWLAPFAACLSARWFLALTAASSIFLFRFYDTISQGWPWVSGTSTNPLLPLWVYWGLLPWLVIVAWIASVAMTSWKRRAAGTGNLSESSAIPALPSLPI